MEIYSSRNYIEIATCVFFNSTANYGGKPLSF